jgi:Putative beta-barrel porin 2
VIFRGRIHINTGTLWQGCRLAGWVALLGITHVAWAQDRYDLGGGFLGAAAVETVYVHENNYFYETSNGISANGYSIKPTADIARTSSTVGFKANAALDHTEFDFPGNLDTWTDYNAGGELGWQAAERHNFNLSGTFRHGHDAAGLRRTEGVPDFSFGNLDQWDASSGFLSYRYGSPGALGGSTLRVGAMDRHYLTNRAATVFLDYTTNYLDYELAYAYSPRTAVLLYAGQIGTNYARPSLFGLGDRNGNEFDVRTGLRWIATGKTSGEMQVGLRNYSLDGREQPSRQSTSFKVEINWEPTPIALIQLVAGNATNETYRSDTFYIEETSAGLSWRQQWTLRFSTQIAARYSFSNFVGAGRQDNFYGGDLGFDYRVMHHINAFGSFVMRSRQSNFVQRDYSAPEARLGIRWSL